MKLSRLVAASLVLAIMCMSVHGLAQRRSNAQLGMPNSSQQGDPSFSDGAGMGAAGMASISGTVQTTDGHAVANAAIELHNTGRGTPTVNGRTDASGTFALYNIPPGEYEITASSGTSEVRDRVRVEFTRTSSIELRLAKKSDEQLRADNGGTVSVSQYKVPAKARSLYEKAAQAMAHGKLDVAYEKATAALSVFPKFAEALTLKGVLESDKGKSVEAIADLQQAIQYDPKYSLSYVALASELNSAGRFDESLLILGQAERLTTTLWQTYFELARANIGKGQYATALRNINRASELQGTEKSSPEMHLVRGYALVGLRETPRATQEIEKYLALRPQGHTSENARKLLDQLHENTITASK